MGGVAAYGQHARLFQLLHTLLVFLNHDKVRFFLHKALDNRSAHVARAADDVVVAQFLYLRAHTLSPPCRLPLALENGGDQAGNAVADHGNARKDDENGKQLRRLRHDAHFAEATWKW